MRSRGRRPTPAERERLAPDVEALVLGLFSEGSEPIFEGTGAHPEAIRRFAQSEAVLDATFDYLRTLMRIWRSQHPGKRLSLLSADPRPSTPGGAPPAAACAEAAPGQVPDPAEGEEDVEPLAGPPEASSDPEPQPADAAGPAATDSAGMADAPTPHRPDDERDGAAESQPLTELRPGEVPAEAVLGSGPPEPRASFRLPNAKVGVGYAATIEGWDANGQPVAVLDVAVPSELGLEYDAERGELRGTPRSDGDHRLPVTWVRPGDEGTHSGDCLLIVNPDPRSLWKVIEPPAEAPYPKAHQHAQIIEGDGFRIAAASRRGRSHEHAGSFRDDDFFVHQDAAGGWSVLIVADGAGSAKFSREGARLAALTAGEHVADALAGELGAKMTAALAGWAADPQGAQQTMGSAFHYLFHQAGVRAVQAIEHRAQADEAVSKDYATTLLAAVVRRQASATFLASFWLGDGAIAAYGPRGKVRLMGNPDGGEFAGQTRFLDRAAMSDQGERGFAKRVQFGYFEDLAGVMLMTDGVSDPRFETDSGLKDPARWDELWDELKPILDGPEPGAVLLDWLGFFSPGNHDDRTIAVLW